MQATDTGAACHTESSIAERAPHPNCRSLTPHSVASGLVGIGVFMSKCVYESPERVARGPSEPSEQRQKVRTLWAQRPFLVAAGQCLAVRMDGAELMVALRRVQSPGRVEWVPAARVLTSSEAERWSKMGFVNSD